MPEEDEAASTNTVHASPPPPPPPPPPPLLCPPPPSQVKSKFFKKVAESSDPSVGGCDELKRLIRNQQERFGAHLKWLLYNQHIPSLIQEGPQCGLVALWMAGGILSSKQEVTLDHIVQVATTRGYTIHGEMFSADNMSGLAVEVFGCDCDLLKGGMEGENRQRILGHLTAGLPVLIPYDEDFNHEPCQRDGHRAHWAVVSGVLLGIRVGSFGSDPEVSRLLYPPPSPLTLNTGDIEQLYLIAKQGKSLRYQLWEYGALSRSNSQLLHLDPKRSSDGNVYVVPEGGVQAGLCGKTLLLKHPVRSKEEETGSRTVTSSYF
ncbi:actin maturation protease [Hyla sarda]|uniref:actin maturation protease n=1 Tax=Hyla sarda TaxID=327740 RepID=UPI0024C3BEE4|nr:actin maturation protease [Hyla sarda]XP_056394524.1 actin maturation protease [Hyla sarda]XP_056394525.1 actin maturation protease [Hyla sarda]